MQAIAKYKLLIVVFAAYVLLSGWSMLHHSPWGDELIGWNIAKGSASYRDLLTNARYEGHPPGWYSLLWVIAKFTHNLVVVQVFEWMIACTIIFLILFYSPFPTAVKLMIPWGYYFLFEYAVFSRNYAIGVLLVCLLCMIIRGRFRYQQVVYFFLLFCLFNIHLIAIILACSLHLYYLLLQKERGQKNLFLLIYLLVGGLFLAIAVSSIYPPADGLVHLDFKDSKHTLAFKAFFNAPLRCFLPMPSWWKYNFWNSEFMLDDGMPAAVKFFLPVVSLSLIALVFWLLWPNRKCLALFGANLLLSGIISTTSFTLGTARYSGYLFIGAVAAFWLYCYEAPAGAARTRVVFSLLCLQAVAGIWVLWPTSLYRFSNLSEVRTLAAEVPADRPLVTDYWTMNAYSSFVDKPIYCLDLQEKKSFIRWDSKIVTLFKKPYRFSGGLDSLFQGSGAHEVYMFSTSDLGGLTEYDKRLLVDFQVELIDKREGAIEKGSNIYLYKISEKNDIAEHS